MNANNVICVSNKTLFSQIDLELVYYIVVRGILEQARIQSYLREAKCAKNDGILKISK